MSYPWSRSSSGLHPGFLASRWMVFQALSQTQWTPAERRARWGGAVDVGGVSYFAEWRGAAPGEEESSADEGVSPCRSWGDLGGLAAEE